MLTNTGIFEGHALITQVTLRTGTYVSALNAVAGCALLARIGIAQIQHYLKWWEETKNSKPPKKVLHV